MRKLFAFLAAFWCASAVAQQPIIQSGSVTPGHTLSVVTNGIVTDGGTPAQGNLTGLGITASGPSLCINSGPVSAAYNQLCFGATQTGGGTMSIQNNGGATGGFTLSINGANQGFVTTNLPTTNGGVVCFQNVTGAIGNCSGGGSIITGPVSSTNSALVRWNGTNGTVVENSAVTMDGSGNMTGAGFTGGVVFNGSSSGSTTLQSSAVSSGTLTLPATTDTLTGKATTDTLTNKTYDTAGTGNVFRINGTQISAITGTGSAVLATSPTLVTPALGAATATTIDGLTITTSTGTLTIANGKTLTANNSLTLAGTDSTTMTFPTSSDTVVGLAATQTLTNKTLTSPTLNTPVINNASTLSAGTNGTLGGTLVLNGSSSGSVTVAVLAGAGTTNFTLPNTNGSSGQLLQTDGAGNTSWTTATGTGTVTAITAGSGLATGTAANITSTGTLYDIRPPGGRLTLVTGVPVMVSNQTAKSTVYYDCYNGNGVVPYYNGTDDVTEAVAACEVSMTMQTSGTGVTNSGGVFDVWWVHGGASRICVATNGSGGGWASDTGGSNTARGTGYSQLDKTTRSYITNKNSIANCYNGATNYGSVSANQATYLGTLYTTSAGQTGMAYTASGSGGGANVLGLFNAYNRLPVVATSQDTASSWTYASTTWRKADNNANNSIQWVDGTQQVVAECNYNVLVATTSATTGNTGCAFDWASGAPSIMSSVLTNGANASTAYSLNQTLPLTGLHTANAVENASTTTATYYGSGFANGAGQTQQLTLKISM